MRKLHVWVLKCSMGCENLLCDVRYKSNVWCENSLCDVRIHWESMTGMKIHCLLYNFLCDVISHCLMWKSPVWCENPLGDARTHCETWKTTEWCENLLSDEKISHMMWEFTVWCKNPYLMWQSIVRSENSMCDVWFHRVLGKYCIASDELIYVFAHKCLICKKQCAEC